MKSSLAIQTLRSGMIAAAAALVIGSGLAASSAQAAFIETLDQVGSNVVVTGSGTIDLTDLFFTSSGSQAGPDMNPSFDLIANGPSASINIYAGFSGPSSFGPGGFAAGSSGIGDHVGIAGASNQLFLPSGYVSGSLLSDTSTYNGRTFASLGVTPGTYTWTWGTGVHADSFTLQIGAVPDTGSTFGLLALALAALMGACRLRSIRLA